MSNNKKSKAVSCKEKETIIIEFAQKIKEQQNIPDHYCNILVDNYWDLIGDS